MDESMVFRVAKAISDNLHGGLAWINATTVARAAIEAMREPTEEMQEAGAEELWSYDERFDEGEKRLAKIWAAMIDEALK